MSRKLFNHFLKSKYIDIQKEEPPIITELKKNWYVKYLEREKSYKPQKRIK